VDHLWSVPAKVGCRDKILQANRERANSEWPEFTQAVVLRRRRTSRRGDSTPISEQSVHRIPDATFGTTATSQTTSGRLKPERGARLWIEGSMEENDVLITGYPQTYAQKRTFLVQSKRSSVVWWIPCDASTIENLDNRSSTGTVNQASCQSTAWMDGKKLHRVYSLTRVRKEELSQ
jgi:hypothetical protein